MITLSPSPTDAITDCINGSHVLSYDYEIDEEDCIKATEQLQALLDDNARLQARITELETEKEKDGPLIVKQILDSNLFHDNKVEILKAMLDGYRGR